VHLVTNTLPTDDARACHPSMDAPPPKLMPAIAPAPYPTLTYQLAATRLREMGVDVPGDGWITDVFLEDVVKVYGAMADDLDEERGAREAVGRYADVLDKAERDARLIWRSLKDLVTDVADGEDYGEGFDLNARLTAIIEAVDAMRDGMDR